MKYEFRELNERAIEEARRNLVNKAHSKNQTHAGYLIGFIIGSLTLISRWDIFFESSQKPNVSINGHLFFAIFSVIAALAVYFMQRACYWTSYGGAAENFSISLLIKLFDKYKSKPENENLEKQVSPMSCILNCAVAQHLEDLQFTDEPLKLTTKFAAIGRKRTILLMLGVGLTVYGLIWIGYITL